LDDVAPKKRSQAMNSSQKQNRTARIILIDKTMQRNKSVEQESGQGALLATRYLSNYFFGKFSFYDVLVKLLQKHLF